MFGASRPVPPPPLAESVPRCDLRPHRSRRPHAGFPQGFTSRSTELSKKQCPLERASPDRPARVPSRAPPTEPAGAFAPAVIVSSLLVRPDRTFCSPRLKVFPAVPTGVATAPAAHATLLDTPSRAAWFAGFAPPLELADRGRHGPCALKGFAIPFGTSIDSRVG
jgi:hypothetical protein